MTSSLPPPGSRRAKALARKMYAAYQQGEAKAAIEERFLGTRTGHGKRFTAIVRRELGIETESRHPLAVENELLRQEVATLTQQLSLDLGHVARVPKTVRPRPHHLPGSAALLSFSAKGYRSLKDAVLTPGPLTCLIGGNATGKSNIISALRLLQAAVEEDLEAAVSRMGGQDQLYAGATDEAPQIFEFKVEYRPGGRAPTEYILTIGFDELGRAIAKREYLRLKRSPGQGRRRVFLDITDGRGFAFNEQGEAKQPFRAEDPGTLALTGLGYLEDQPDIAQFREYIESWVFLSADPAPMRSPSKDRRTTRLSQDAGNIGPLLRTLERADPSVVNEVVDDLRLFYPKLRGLAAEPGREGLVYVVVGEADLDRDLPLSLQSDGFLFFLSIAVAVRTAPRRGLVVIEEPEHGLHPAALPILSDMFRSSADHTQILLTTHSPRLVDLLHPSEVVVVTRSDGATVLQRPAPELLDQWLDSYTLGELWERHGLGDSRWFESV